MLPESVDVVVVGAGNAALCAALAAPSRAPRCWCWSARRRGARRQQPLHRRRHARRLRRRRRPARRSCRTSPTTRSRTPTSAPTPRTSSSTTWRGSPSTAPTPTWSSSWSRAATRRMRWMRDKGVRFAPIYGRQAFKVDGRFKFWGGLTVEAWGGGPGLVEALYRRRPRATASRSSTRPARVDLSPTTTASTACACAARGQDQRRRAPRPWCWPAAASRPTPSGARATSARAGTSPRCAARASTPATASAWRSTSAPCPTGNWSGCHAVGWDRNAPEFGDLAVGDGFQKHSYPFGIMVNADGERFVDEGADFRNYTYAKYGRVILDQPQPVRLAGLRPARSLHLLRDEYRIRQVTKVHGRHARGAGAPSSRASNAERGLATIEAYNAAVQHRRAVQSRTSRTAAARAGWTIAEVELGQPARRRRRSRPTQSPAASPSPSAACASRPTAQVLDTDGAPIPGLYAAGELVGGLFYFNYPGGTGLMSGSVFGRIAGTTAGQARHARRRDDCEPSLPTSSWSAAAAPGSPRRSRRAAIGRARGAAREEPQARRLDRLVDRLDQRERHAASAPPGHRGLAPRTIGATCRCSRPTSTARDNDPLRRILCEPCPRPSAGCSRSASASTGRCPSRRTGMPRMHNVLPNSRSYICHLERHARRIGVEIRCDTGARRLIQDGGRVIGVEATTRRAAPHPRPPRRRAGHRRLHQRRRAQAPLHAPSRRPRSTASTPPRPATARRWRSRSARASSTATWRSAPRSASSRRSADSLVRRPAALAGARQLHGLVARPHAAARSCARS